MVKAEADVKGLPDEAVCINFNLNLNLIINLILDSSCDVYCMVCLRQSEVECLKEA